jgi:MFS family permease
MTRDATERPPSIMQRMLASSADPVNQAIVALGFTQIIAWGTTLYALGVLGKPIAQDTGWSQGLVYGGMSVGLLASGAVSMPVGRWLDRRGGREVMCLGSVLAALGLALLSQVRSPAAYLAVWVLVGVAMRLTLYDAAFASLVQLSHARGRRAISLLTLFGGLASTLLWPAGAALDFLYGWRITLLVFAALNLFVCLPLHWYGLRPRRLSEPLSDDADAAVPAADAAAQSLVSPPLQGSHRTWGMVLFSVVMATSAFVTGAMAAHLVPVLAAGGLDPRYAIALASAKGIAQTLARLVDLVFGRNLHAISLGRLTIALMPLSFLVLLLGGSGWLAASVFVLLFGAANGLATIVRGAVPLSLFGPSGYGEVLGKLAVPVLIVNATAPTLFAIAEQRFGMPTAVALLAGVAALAAVAMEIMATWYRRTQTPRPVA